MNLLTRNSLIVPDILLALVACNVFAAEDIARLPVDWNAEGEVKMRVEGDIRIIEMSENVEVTQGSLRVTGDNATFEYTADTRELIRVTITGSPVNYRQELEEGGLEGDDLEEESDVVTGTSDTLIFYEDEISLETMIEMIGNAIINTPDSSMSCTEIVYNAARNLIPRSTGPCGGALASPSN